MSDRTLVEELGAMVAEAIVRERSVMQTEPKDTRDGMLCLTVRDLRLLEMRAIKLERDRDRLREMVFKHHEIINTYYGGCHCDDCETHRLTTEVPTQPGGEV